MAYTDISYCDSVLSSTAWQGLTSAEKQNAINIGELWIDKHYTCEVDDPVQTNIQKANALLADKYASGELFTPKEGSLKSKEVKADTVTVKKQYSGSSAYTDSFSEIYLLLGSECTEACTGTKDVIRV